MAIPKIFLSPIRLGRLCSVVLFYQFSSFKNLCKPGQNILKLEKPKKWCSAKNPKTVYCTHYSIYEKLYEIRLRRYTIRRPFEIHEVYPKFLDSFKSHRKNLPRSNFFTGNLRNPFKFDQFLAPALNYFLSVLGLTKDAIFGKLVRRVGHHWVSPICPIYARFTIFIQNFRCTIIRNVTVELYEYMLYERK